jgi:hypothetical protein
LRRAKKAKHMIQLAVGGFPWPEVSKDHHKS